MTPLHTLLENIVALTKVVQRDRAPAKVCAIDSIEGVGA